VAVVEKSIFTVMKEYNDKILDVFGHLDYKSAKILRAQVSLKGLLESAEQKRKQCTQLLNIFKGPSQTYKDKFDEPSNWRETSGSVDNPIFEG
jgi:hypothetical protein